ncbi:hypothetical protein D3C72_965620 [compost metagenome]
MGNSYDFGARMYNSQLGRWLALDPLAAKYPGLSPYNFVANTPIQAKDPDGRVIIFINGLWGKPNNVGIGGTVSYWGQKWIDRVQDRIGDHASPIYLDGALGGTKNMAGNLYNVNRIEAGRHDGYMMAEGLIANLKRDKNGFITETIKIVTNSMGTAYGRGYTTGVYEWVADENMRRTEYNNRLTGAIRSVNARLEEGSITPSTATRLIGELGPPKQPVPYFKFEIGVDLDAHNVDWADPNIEGNYYMISNESDRNFFELHLTKPKHVNGALRLGLKQDGTSEMRTHHSHGAPASLFPRSTAEDPNPR